MDQNSETNGLINNSELIGLLKGFLSSASKISADRNKL